MEVSNMFVPIPELEMQVNEDDILTRFTIAPDFQHSLSQISGAGLCAQG